MRTLEALKKLALKVCKGKTAADLVGLNTVDEIIAFIAENFDVTAGV